ETAQKRISNEDELRRAYGLAHAVLALDPKHAPSHAAVATVIELLSAQHMAQAKIDDAIPHYKAALAKDATSPFTGGAAIKLMAGYASALLNAEPPQNTEARDVLKAAVAAAKDAKDAD